MRKLVILAVAWISSGQFLLASLSPADVAVVFNRSDPESVKLAKFYQEKRSIPEENMIGLPLPTTQDISREQYDSALRNPLRSEFKNRGWVQLAKDANGLILPVRNKIRVLVTLRGVPLRIQSAETKTPANPQNPIVNDNKASVDSELALFGIEGTPIDAVLKNAYFQNTASITDTNFPFQVLTARIDAPTYATCERMITDAIETEKTGLWGRAYIDLANKVPMGDAWLENVAKQNLAAGIPTVVDRFNETLPTNYPAAETAIYFGWYDWNVSGPFLNPRFRFKKGAIAAHLHSFSAEQLRDGSKNWCGPLLERGAAVTLGNVFEPYLHLTHQFDGVMKNLLAGRTWVEAAWSSIPVTSWQAVVLGDPLYRPFSHLDGSGEKQADDIPYRALRAAATEWSSETSKRHAELRKAAERMQNGVFLEAVGLDLLAQGKAVDATEAFRAAKNLYPTTEDKMRQDFHLIAINRSIGLKSQALQLLREAIARYGPIPETESLHAWLLLLDPPPPPVDPAKAPK